MNDGIKRARERRNLLEELGAKIPGFRGYLERELRRDVDKMQRDWLANQVDRARFALNGTIRAWTKAGRLDVLSTAGSVEKALDRLANRIRHADYGASGFFDAVKIRDAELEKIYAFDLALSEAVEYLALQIEQLPPSSDDDTVNRLYDAVQAADRRFDERATVFEDVTQKGGA
ncbi:MAG TPA: hypothetical protein VLT81_12330 [Chondromyces sp.]|nr:hypothetical protein [Chondromyces sp.]